MHHRLPPELIESIISHITSTSELYNLLFVSRFIQQEAERFLYRDITIDDEGFSESLLTSFCNPRLASLVKGFNLEVSQRFKSTVGTPCLLSLHTTLRHLAGLKHFSIEGCLSFDTDGKTFYLLEHATTSLESLTFDWINPSHIPFLQRQIQLKELIMHNGGTAWDSATFLHLRIIGCPGDLTVDCLGGGDSKVSRLQWTQGVPDDGWSPFHTIRSLDLYLFTIDIDVFSRILAKFPSLEYLKCTVQPDGFLQYVRENDRTLISSLQLASLHKFYLHTTRQNHREQWDWQPLFDSIPSLFVVQLQSQKELMSRQYFRRDPSLWSEARSQPDEWKHYNSAKSISQEVEESLRKMTLVDHPTAS